MIVTAVVKTTKDSRWSANDGLSVVVLEDVATDVTERIVAESVALTPRAKHSRDDVPRLCSRYSTHWRTQR